MSDSKTSGNANAAIANLVATNGMSYRFKPDVSTSIQRGLNINYPTGGSVYEPSQTTVFSLNTGSMFCEPQHSFLQFTVTATGGFSFGDKGSGCNVLSRVRCVSKSGDEIENIGNWSGLAYIMNQYGQDSNFLSTYGDAMGFGAAGTFDGAIDDPTNKRRIIIPMSRLLGLFNFDGLLPAVVLSGLRIELTWERASVALMDADAVAPPTFKIYNPEIHTMLVQQTDALLREVLSMSANQGAEMLFTSSSSSTYSFVSADRINVRQDKAVSRALSYLGILRAEYNENEYKYDSFASHGPWDITSCQLQLGSIFMPSQPFSSVENDVNRARDDVAKTMHYYAVQNFRERQNVMPRVTLTDFKDNAGIVYFSLERAGALSGSGVPLSNSRAVLANIKFGSGKGIGGDVTGYQFVSYLHHHKLLTAYMQNSVVSE